MKGLLYMAEILFRDKRHEELFYSLIKKMKRKDCYHGSAAYLLCLDEAIREHVNRVFDFDEDMIKPDCIFEPWQTGTSKKTTRLLFNLWNGRNTDGATYEDTDGYEQDLPSKYYTPDEIFSCNYAPYYVQAMKLRFPEYF